MILQKGWRYVALAVIRGLGSMVGLELQHNYWTLVVIPWSYLLAIYLLFLS